MSRQLTITAHYLKSAGMALSAGKSVGFFPHRREDARVSVSAQLSVRGEPIRSLGVGKEFTYLGVAYTLTRGFPNREHLTDSVRRVRRLPMKSHQKVLLVMQYVVSSFAHRLTIDLPSSNALSVVCVER